MMFGRLFPLFAAWPVVTQLESIDNTPPETAAEPTFFKKSLLVCVLIASPFFVNLARQ
jgi:hypothetical protein